MCHLFILYVTNKELLILNHVKTTIRFMDEKAKTNSG